MSPPFRISFEHELQYKEVHGLDGIYPAVVIGLIGPAGQDDLLAIVDTGAHYCLFDGRRAKSLGLDLASGQAVTLGGLSGNLPARLHRVTLEIEGARFECDVAFSEGPIRRELLGRHDLFGQIRLGFREGQSCWYLHPQP